MNSTIISRSHRCIGLTLVLLMTVLVGCADDDTLVMPEPVGGFQLEVRYDSMRTVPGGDGLLPLRIIPDSGFSGNVNLDAWCETSVHAALKSRSVDARFPVSEIRLQPDSSCDTLHYSIIVRGSNNTDTAYDTCEVRVVTWDQTAPSDADNKRDELLAWVEAQYPDLEDWDTLTWEAFSTYPQILIVEHVTYLSERWEVRVCYHVMIAPYDWSYICLRRRAEWEPILAARRESDGTVHAVPIDEYPDMWD